MSVVNPNIALIGPIVIQYVQEDIHAIGNVSVGHTVGRGVRMLSPTSRKRPEQLQIRATFIDNDRSTKKLLLQQLNDTGIPVPFIGATVLPLVKVTQLVFTRRSSRRVMPPLKGPVVEFIATLEEFQLNRFLKLGAQLAWLAWTTAITPDPSTGRKLAVSDPGDDNITAVVPSEFVQISTDRAGLHSSDLGDEDGNWTTSEATAALTLHERYDKVPIDPDGAFPQVVKILYPPRAGHEEEFNDVGSSSRDQRLSARAIIPDGYTGYEYPDVTNEDIQTVSLTFSPRDAGDEIYLVFTVRINGEARFSRKVVTGVQYLAAGMVFAFKEIGIKRDNLQPDNAVGGEYGSRLELGVRMDN